MTRYLLRRLPSALVVLAIASFVIFAMMRLVPGDPVATLAGPDATPEARAAIRADLGLDQPLVTQYVTWLRPAAAAATSVRRTGSAARSRTWSPTGRSTRSC